MANKRWIYHLDRKTFKVTLEEIEFRPAANGIDPMAYSYETRGEAHKFAMLAIGAEITKLKAQLERARAALFESTEFDSGESSPHQEGRK